jgi:hypothetical protein
MSIWWKTDPVPDERTAFARASAGMAYLDQHYGPAWDRRLDVEHLDIASPVCCVLAQLKVMWISPSLAYEYGFSAGVLNDLLVVTFKPAPLVRSFARLTQAWKVLLRERQYEREVRARLREARFATQREVEVTTNVVTTSDAASPVEGHML